MIGLVVNTAQTRAYDQFHIHIECLRQDVYDSLRHSAEQVLSVWAPLAVGGATFQARKIAADGLDGSNLYELLATLRPDTAPTNGEYTVVVAGAQFKSGPGFIVLSGTGPPGRDPRFHLRRRRRRGLRRCCSSSQTASVAIATCRRTRSKQ